MRRLLTLALLLSGVDVAAQCGTCTVGDTCTVSPPFPNVCPAIAPVGVVGVPYVFDVTFWIPPSFAEPTTGLNVVLTQITVLGISNMPLGLTFEANNPGLVYYPQQDPFGCVRVCGIPMAPMNDSIVVRVNGVGTVGGVSVNQDQELKVPITILPPDGSNVGFSFEPDSACAPLTVSFTSLLSTPGLTSSFSWNFGGGNTYSGPSPPTQTFSDPGLHVVSLQTIVTVPALTQVLLTGVSNAWCGDVDEPNLPIVGCVGQPDLYFTITNSIGGQYRSATVNNVQSTTWGALSVPLTFPPFTLRFYDQDAISADDLLGTFTLSGAIGTTPYSAGGTAGQAMVQTQTVQVFNNADTVVVHPPPITDLVFDLNAGTLCALPMGLASYAWSLDAVPVPGETGSCVTAANGQWSLIGTNQFGCTSTSTYTVIGVGVPEGGASREMISIHPVPNDGQFVLRADHWRNSDPVRVLIYDATGRIVHDERVVLGGRSLVRPINMGIAAPGTYMLRSFNSGEVRTRAFIIGLR